jgi:hypothetical protein
VDTLGRSLPLAEQPVANVDGPGQPGVLGVVCPKVAGHRTNGPVAKGRDDSADAICRDHGIGVDPHDDRPPSLDERPFLRDALAAVLVQKQDPPARVGLPLQHGAQQLTVPRPVVHHPDPGRAAVVLAAEGPQAFAEQFRLLVVTGDDHVDGRCPPPTRDGAGGDATDRGLLALEMGVKRNDAEEQGQDDGKPVQRCLTCEPLCSGLKRPRPGASRGRRQAPEWIQSPAIPG